MGTEALGRDGLVWVGNFKFLEGLAFWIGRWKAFQQVHLGTSPAG